MPAAQRPISRPCLLYVPAARVGRARTYRSSSESRLIMWELGGVPLPGGAALIPSARPARALLGVVSVLLRLGALPFLAVALCAAVCARGGRAFG